MDEPVNYGALAEFLSLTRALQSLDIASALAATGSTKAEVGWRPRYDIARLVEAEWDYRRAEGDPRKVWHPRVKRSGAGPHSLRP